MWSLWTLFSSSIGPLLCAAVNRFHEGLELVYYLSELRHEAWSQMAILKHHPAAILPHLCNG